MRAEARVLIVGTSLYSVYYYAYVFEYVVDLDMLVEFARV